MWLAKGNLAEVELKDADIKNSDGSIIGVVSNTYQTVFVDFLTKLDTGFIKEITAGLGKLKALTGDEKQLIGHKKLVKAWGASLKNRKDKVVKEKASFEKKLEQLREGRKLV